MTRILIAGGSGMLGRHLVEFWQAAGHEVTVLSRRPDRRATPAETGPRLVAWRPPLVDRVLLDAVAWADAIVNLAGESIGTRPWLPGRRKALRQSRLDATGALVQAIAELPPADRPAVLVNASGADVYGDRADEPCAETTTPGDSFLAGLVLDWEAAALKAQAHGVRVVVGRTAFIVAADAPAFRLLALPTRLFAGGPIGGGRQVFSFVGLSDVVGLYDLAAQSPELSGPVNFAAPTAPTQAEVARILGRLLHRPARLPLPAIVLRLMLGGQADVLLHGRRVIPEKALAAGFEFATPTFAEAAAVALGRPIRPDASGPGRPEIG
jgi:uncharacterized protein (TIGR01777 family)